MGRGSPPRVREERHTPHLPSRGYGITPACAGRTGAVGVYIACIRDHPRVCGKNTANAKMTGRVAGSPPRVREEPVRSTLHGIASRITPACAGRTVLQKCTEHKLEDHPRVCGKNEEQRPEINPLLGSPPRVREEQ